MSGQLTDAVFAGFGMRLGVDNGRRERIDEVTDFRSIGVDASGGVGGGVSGAFLGSSGGVTGLDIENFDVVVGEVVGGVVCEVVEVVGEVLFFSLLKLRPEALIIFFAWCWRTCSWSLLFDSKVFSQCLQTAFLQID